MSTLSAKEYKCFEDIKRIRPDGSEYWAARELAPVLDYTGTPSSILQRVVAKSTENFPIILIFLVVIALAITAVVLIWRNHKRSQEDTVYHEEFSEEEDEHEE